MKRLAAALLVATLPLLPAAAWAGSSTDAALGLGAFAVFNQILGGTGIFAGLHHPAPVYAPAHVAPPPPVYVVPRPVYVAPAPVYVAPAPVYVAPRPVFIHRHGHGHGHGHWHGKHAHVKRWKHYRHHDD